MYLHNIFIANAFRTGRRVAYDLVIKQSEVEKEVELFEKAIVKACGPKMYKNEIYYIEACVYLSAIKELLDSGHLVWFLYDGLYASGAMIGELFKALVDRIIEIRFNDFYKEYMNNRGINV